MKLFINMFFVLLFLVPLVTVQASKVTMGFKAGTNISNFTGDDYDTDPKMGIILGAFVKYSATPYFGIQPEISYSAKGAKENGYYYDNYTDLWYPYKGTIKLNYIEVPLLAVFSIPTQANVNPYFLAGPALGLKINSKAKLEMLGMSVEESLDDIKALDFSLALGAGMGFELPQTHLCIEARYTFGLSSIDDSIYNYDAKNSAISICMALGFRL